MQYAVAAGSNDVDVIKLMRDVLSTQETQLIYQLFLSHTSKVSQFFHVFLSPLCRCKVVILSPVEEVMLPAVIS